MKGERADRRSTTLPLRHRREPRLQRASARHHCEARDYPALFSKGSRAAASCLRLSEV